MRVRVGEGRLQLGVSVVYEEPARVRTGFDFGHTPSRDDVPGDSQHMVGLKMSENSSQ